MRLIIIDDQRILAEGLKLLLSQEADIEVVAIGESGEEALALADLHQPDIMLMDIQMPVMNGVEAIRRIKTSHSEIKFLILTTFSDDAYIFEGIKNGAAGYLLKDASPKEIAEALRVVHSGGALFQPDIAAKMIRQFTTMANHQEERSTQTPLKQPVDEGERLQHEHLTDREIEIISLVAEGLSNIEIGEKLFLTEGTVKNNLTRILQKLELRDRTQLAIYWLKHSSSI